MVEVLVLIPNTYSSKDVQFSDDIDPKGESSILQAIIYESHQMKSTRKNYTKKKLDGNYTRMLRVILNKSWWQHPTKHQLYGPLPPITKTIQVRRTRHAGHCWISRDKLISDVHLWTPTYGRAKAGRPVRTYIQQLCENMGCSPENQPEPMNDREKWRERAWISVLAAWHDDDDNYIQLNKCYIVIYSITTIQ